MRACWPAGCPTSARCRCAPARRLAEALRGVGVDVREWDADAALADRPARGPAGRRRHRPARRRGRGRLPAGRARAARRAVRRHPGARPAGSPGTSRPRRPSSPAPGSTPRTGSRCRTRTFRELGAGAVLDAMVDRLGLPLMVKPDQGGSALGARSSADAEDLPAAMVSCFAYGDTVLVERFVDGVEVAVSVVDDGDGPRGAARRRDRAEGRRLRLHRPLHAGADRRTTPGPAVRRRRRAGGGAGRRGARGARAARPVAHRRDRRRRTARCTSSRSTSPRA